MTEEQEKFLQMNVLEFRNAYLGRDLKSRIVLDEALCKLPEYSETYKRTEIEIEQVTDLIAESVGGNHELIRQRLVLIRMRIISEMFSSTLLLGLKMRDPTPFEYYIKLGWVDQILQELDEEAKELDKKINEFLGHAAFKPSATEGRPV